MTADARHGGPEHALDWLEHDAMQRKALVLAVWANGILMQEPDLLASWPSDDVECFRSARDILEQVARG